MKKVVDIVLKVLLSLLIIMPIIGAFGVMPAPTADLYNSPDAFAFISILMSSKYIMYINAIVFATAFVLMWTKRMALAAILILPITVNIVAFHLFLDGGLFTPGAIMGDLLGIINLYFIWDQREHYLPLLKKSN